MARSAWSMDAGRTLRCSTEAVYATGNALLYTKPSSLHKNTLLYKTYGLYGRCSSRNKRDQHLPQDARTNTWRSQQN